jgi:hypothetical protein
VTPTCLVARAGPCDAESASTKRTITPPYAGKHSAQPSRVSPVRRTERLCWHANHWKCPVVMVSIPLARRHGRRVSVASRVDRQSKRAVNFRRTAGSGSLRNTASALVATEVARRYRFHSGPLEAWSIQSRLVSCSTARGFPSGPFRARGGRVKRRRLGYRIAEWRRRRL